MEDDSSLKRFAKVSRMFKKDSARWMEESIVSHREEAGMGFI